MKKILILTLMILLSVGLTACKDTPEPAPQPVDPGYTSFREEAEEMTVEQAETYITEHTDPTDTQYKEALYTVNKEAASAVIAEAQKAAKETAGVQKLFEGIFFRFLEGEDFSNAAIKQKVFMRGNWAMEESGWYRFTFIDRTLAGAATMNNDHALKEYTEVLELLLSAPNVTVMQLEGEE